MKIEIGANLTFVILNIVLIIASSIATSNGYSEVWVIYLFSLIILAVLRGCTK